MSQVSATQIKQSRGQRHRRVKGAGSRSSCSPAIGPPRPSSPTWRGSTFTVTRTVRAGFRTEVDRITRDNVETFLADQLARWRPKTAQIRYGALRQFFKWCQEEGEVTVSPMTNMKPPTVPEVPVPVVSDDDLKALLKACEGSGFEERRDTAVLRLFIDCGLRLAEVTNLSVTDVDFSLGVVGVMGKGSRPRGVPMASKTQPALDRYLRLRKRHAHASSQALWLGSRGPLTSNGVAQLLRRRCKQAGIEQLHPHQIRHTAAHVAARRGWATPT